MVKNKFLFKQRSMARWLLSLGMLCLLFGVPDKMKADDDWQPRFITQWNKSGDFASGTLSFEQTGYSFLVIVGDNNVEDEGVIDMTMTLLYGKSSSETPKEIRLFSNMYEQFEIPVFKGDCSTYSYDKLRDIEFGKNNTNYGDIHGFLVREKFSRYRDNENKTGLIGDGGGRYYGFITYLYLDKIPVEAQYIAVRIDGHWNNKQPFSKTLVIPQTFQNIEVPTDFARTGNNTVTYSGKCTSFDNRKYVVDFYEKEPVFTTPPEMKPLFSSEVSEFNVTSLNLTSNRFENDKNYTLYPVVRSFQENRSVKASNKNYENDHVVFKKLQKLSILGYAKPNNQIDVKVQDATKKEIKLSWTADDEDKDTDGKWYIYRQLVGSDVISKIGETEYYNLDFVDKNLTDEGRVDGLEYDKTYKYTVCFVPKGWNVQGKEDCKGLYVDKEVTLRRDFEITSLVASSVKNQNKITVKWDHSAISDATSSNTYTLYLERTTNPEGDNWESLQEIVVKNNETTSGSYEDTKGLDLSYDYTYRIRIHVQDKEWVKLSNACALSGQSEVTSLVASCGTYSNRVKLQWNVEQLGSNKTYFVLSRKLLTDSDDDNYVDIYSTSGIDDFYSFDDETANPGSYYQYRLSIYALKMEADGSTTKKNMQQYFIDGYCIQTGILSGRIAYGSGTAVEGVKVSIVPSDADGTVKNSLYALDFANESASLSYHAKDGEMDKLYGKDFSTQMYVRPSSNIELGSTQNIYYVPSIFSMTIKVVEDAGVKKCELLYNIEGIAEPVTTGILIPMGKWSNITMAYDKSKKTLTTYVVSKNSNNEIEIKEHVAKSISFDTSDATGIIIGTRGTVGQPFSGMLDEFRHWTRNLTKSDVEKNYFHTLSGTENGIAIYWPMDENFSKSVKTYDLSQTGGAANERHALVSLAPSSEIVPDADMLSISAVTDANGNYVISGVPFSGNGTNYMVTPTMGVHQFNPSSTSCYISSSSLVHSGIDFEDISSFPTSGTVMYEGTTIPVEGAYIYVDGNLSSKDGEAITTDENGEFTVDVPIGDHYIFVSINGHTFVSEGRFPADPNKLGLRHTFESETTGLTFYDNTLVSVAGRVAGGDMEYEKPLGVGAGKANIGKAKITLDFVGNERYYINAKQVQNGLSYSWDINDEQRTFSEASDSISSQVYVEGGKNQITIYTDPKTGEWSAMVPPLKYEAASITVPSQPDIDLSSKLFVLDATNAMAVFTDSIETTQLLQTAETKEIIC